VKRSGHSALSRPTKGSRLWRTRDLAVAGAVDHLKTHP
jgi:hypothetical protein